MTNSYERAITAFRDAGLHVHETEQGKRASAQTPGHSAADRGTSITYNGDLTLIYSFNADTDQVLADVGLEKRDLFDDPAGSRYEYSEGRIVTRTPDKVFKQLGNKKDASLYGIESLTREGPVYVVEGEKDVNTATYTCGVAAVSQAGGANNPPSKADWSVLSGRDVLIVQDADAPGRKRAEKVAQHLTALADRPATVTIVGTANGRKDFSDHIAAGHTIHELTPVSETFRRRKINFIPASSVKTQRVRWKVDNWIPANSLTLLAGREGLGKSTIACGWAAQETRGELDGNKGVVAYLNTEDSRSLTVKPRLEAAGADLDRVLFLDVETEDGGEGYLTLPGDTSLLADRLEAQGVTMVVLDAAKSVMSSNLSGDKDHDVRRFLEPLASMADRLGIVIIGLVHFGKRDSSDTGKLMLGSIAWSQVARSVLSIAKDKDDEGTLVVTNTKRNLAPREVSREVRLESKTVMTEDGEVAEVACSVWGKETNVSAADLLAEQGGDADERSEIEAVVMDYLMAHGGSAPANDVLKATRAAGLSDNAVKKARKKFGVETTKTGMGGGWMWSISTGTGFEDSPKTPEGAEDSRARTQAPSAPSREPSATATSDAEEKSSDSPQQDVTPGTQLRVNDRYTAEIEDTIFGSLHTEQGLSKNVLFDCFPKKSLSRYGMNNADDLDAYLHSLIQEGEILQDNRGRYLKASKAA